MASDDGLVRRIRDLRRHLEQGRLMELRPIELGHGTGHLPGETTVKIIVADLDDLDDPEGSAARDMAASAVV